MIEKNKKAIILLSGGLDSATILAIAQKQGFDCYALSFRYGQKHSIELKAASDIVEANGVVEHRIIDIDLAQLGGSALTDYNISIPKDRTSDELDADIPITYVPVRNMVFLSYAVAWAEVIGSFDIFIGVNCLDYSGYPDCRPNFIDSFEQTANFASASAVKGKGRYQIHAPIIEMTKSQIIELGLELGVDYLLTHSCYDPDSNGKPCGHCDSCQLRLKGFKDAGVTDPVEYSNES